MFMSQQKKTKKIKAFISSETAIGCSHFISFDWVHQFLSAIVCVPAETNHTSINTAFSKCRKFARWSRLTTFSLLVLPTTSYCSRPPGGRGQQDLAAGQYDPPHPLLLTTHCTATQCSGPTARLPCSCMVHGSILWSGAFNELTEFIGSLLCPSRGHPWSMSPSGGICCDRLWQGGGQGEEMRDVTLSRFLRAKMSTKLGLISFKSCLD
jgi:hypothetical protein